MWRKIQGLFHLWWYVCARENHKLLRFTGLKPFRQQKSDHGAHIVIMFSRNKSTLVLLSLFITLFSDDFEHTDISEAASHGLVLLLFTCFFDAQSTTDFRWFYNNDTSSWVAAFWYICEVKSSVHFIMIQMQLLECTLTVTTSWTLMCAHGITRNIIFTARNRYETFSLSLLVWSPKEKWLCILKLNAEVLLGMQTTAVSNLVIANEQPSSSHTGHFRITKVMDKDIKQHVKTL